MSVKVLGEPYVLSPIPAAVMATESSRMAGSPAWVREQVVGSVVWP